jgi:mannan endo-1,4-beta-mannosidase
MRRINNWKKALIYLPVILGFQTVSSQQTADPQANHMTKCILQYFTSLSTQPNNKVISGQWMNNRGFPQTPQTEFDTAITSVFNQTGKWLGAIGTEYVREITWPNYQITNLAAVNQPLINYFKQGGLIHIKVTFNNPWNGGNANNINGSANLLDITTPGHPAYIAFKKDLDSVAKGFQQLQDSGVTIIFRPFLEMNAGWFWWGYSPTHSPADFTALWQYVFNYLTTVKNLHNILWLFSPSIQETGSGPGIQSELFYYPGDNMVDIIGPDLYNNTIDFPNYSQVLAKGKPLGLAEFGPNRNTVTNCKFCYDYRTLINEIKNKYPAICFWNSWNHYPTNAGATWVYYSLSTQNNVSLLLNDPWVLTREEINFSSCLATSIIQVNTDSFILTISPNPFSAQTVFKSSYTLKNARLTILNSLGQRIKQLDNISGKQFSLHRGNLLAGFYFVLLSERNKIIKTNKLIIAD